MKRKSILFVYSQWQSFVREDYNLLSDELKVNKLQFELNKSLVAFIRGQLLGIISLIAQVPRHDISYIWFCDYHAFWSVLISKIFNKKSIIIVGGFDAVRIPSIDYGLFMDSGLRVKLAKWAYRNCDRIIAVDQSLIKGKNTYAGKGAITGVAHFVEGIEEKSLVIPTGYDSGKWKSKLKKRQVLTVALIKDKKVFNRKGIDLYLNVAKRMPDVPFYLVGLQNLSLIPEGLRDLPNLTIYPILPQKDLINLYAESEVYAQFSVSEGLPNVLCEAMMSGCVPVGTSANGIPNAIGDCGYVLHEKNVDKAVELVDKALNAGEELAICSQNRIKSMFWFEDRKKRLLKVIQEL